MNNHLTVAIVGIGRMGMVHLVNVINNRRLKLLYVIELDVIKARDVINDYHLEDSVTVLSPEEADVAYQDPKLEAVIVCNPVAYHEENITKALRGGKAVFSEKPISASLDGTRKCYEQAERAGKPLMCSFNRRFDPSICKLKERIDNGKVGRVYSVRTCARSRPSPVSFLQLSGGLFHDAAIHELDLICWIMGEYPSTVYVSAYASNDDVKNVDDVDIAIVVLTFPGKGHGAVEISRCCCYGYDQRCEVFGSKGMLISGNQYPIELTMFGEEGAACGRMKGTFQERYADSYANSLEEFIDVTKGIKENPIKKENTMVLSALASACEKSYRAGRVVNFDATKLNSYVAE